MLQESTKLKRELRLDDDVVLWLKLHVNRKKPKHFRTKKDEGALDTYSKLIRSIIQEHEEHLKEMDDLK